MLEDNLIASAYKKYAGVQNIIDIITDNDYLSVTEIADLLCKICNTNSISPQIINKLLLDNHFIIKQSKELIRREKSLDLKPSKYIPTPNSLQYCKKQYYKNFSFYLWKFDIVLVLLNLDFQKNLTLNSAKKIYTVIRKYVSVEFNVYLVFINLIKLQLVLKQESILF